MAQIMREILRKNKYLRAIYRAYVGKISLDLITMLILNRDGEMKSGINK